MDITGPSPIETPDRGGAPGARPYPADPAELQTLLDGHLARAVRVDGQPIALLVPSTSSRSAAGVSALAYRQVATAPYELGLLIGPNPNDSDLSSLWMWTAGRFATPLGTVSVDQEVAAALLSHVSVLGPQVMKDVSEPCIDAQLPWLQRVCSGASIVAIGVRDGEERFHALSAALSSIMGLRRTVLIAVADLPSEAVPDTGRRAEPSILRAVETGDSQQVLQVLSAEHLPGSAESRRAAQDVLPLVLAMEVAAGLGAETATLLGYVPSEDETRSGQAKAGGHAAAMFWRYAAPGLSLAQQRQLLELARLAIASHCEGGASPPFHTTDAELLRLSAVFVTLKTRGELRGCIGHIRQDLPLYRAVQEMAVAAASGDPRFPPLSIDELSQTSLEIAILSPFRRVVATEQIEVGVHGLLIHEGGLRGLLLPQVPSERGWDRETFLENLCYKAGLPASAWVGCDGLYAFTTYAFGEET